MERRTILGLGILIWVAGWFGTPAGISHTRRTFGVLTATIMLMMLAGPAPKVATGMAWAMTLAIFMLDADSIAGGIKTALGER